LRKREGEKRSGKRWMLFLIGMGLSICSPPEQYEVFGSDRCFAAVRESVDLYEDRADRMIEKTNEVRAGCGLGQLTKDETLTEAALIRAVELQQIFAHTRPDGTAFHTVFSQVGSGGTRRGENLARGKAGVHDSVFEAWIDSDGHRANIMNAQFAKIGIGYVEIQGVGYWCQLFAN